MSSLDEIRDSNVIDTTSGKITPGKIIKKEQTLAETDPAFMPTVTNGEPIKAMKRTPTLGDVPPKQPSIKVVQGNAPFDPSELKEFDINSLEKRKPEKSKIETELMDNLDKAVQREKDSITERIDALTAKQYEEFLEMKAKQEEAEYTDPAEPADSTSASTTGDDLYDPDEDDDFFKDEEPEETEEIIATKINQEPTLRIDPVPAEEGPIVYAQSNVSPIAETEKVEEPKTEPDVDDIDEDIDDDIGTITGIATDDLEKDLAAEVGEDENKPDDDAIMKTFTNRVKERIVPIRNRIDLNAFSIGETAITRSDAQLLGIETLSVADHFLPNAGKIVSCSALSGSELMAMNSENSSRNRINTMKDIYSIMYKHIKSEKPKTFDEWLKSTYFSDLNHIFFALYKATFAGSHFMHYECPNKDCKEVFIEDVNFEDMIVYADDETKQKMEAIMNSGDSSATDYSVSLHQISDDFVIGVRNPSIYNVVIEVAGLSDKFLEKYNDLMDIIVYIDNIYWINKEKMTLDPVDLMPDPKNIAKTIARRIKIISDMLRKLPSDNYYELRKCIAEAYPSLANVTYQIPETTCKKCGAKIDALPIEAQQLLFMRHQLGAFVVL